MRGAQDAQKRLGMHRTGAHFDVQRLLKQATPGDPEFRELEDELLQCDHSDKGSFQLPVTSYQFDHWRLETGDWSLPLCPPHFAQHAGGFQVLFEMKVQEAPVDCFELV